MDDPIRSWRRVRSRTLVLTPGQYEFTVAATGYDIVQQAPPTAPNTAVAGGTLPANQLPSNQLPAPAIIAPPALPVTALSPIK